MSLLRIHRKNNWFTISKNTFNKVSQEISDMLLAYCWLLDFKAIIEDNAFEEFFIDTWLWDNELEDEFETTELHLWLKFLQEELNVIIKTEITLEDYNYQKIHDICSAYIKCTFRNNMIEEIEDNYTLKYSDYGYLGDYKTAVH